MCKPSNRISTRSPTLRADGAAQRKRALHMACAVGVAGWIVEERVPAATALPCLAAIEGTRAAHNRLALRADGRDERLRRIERERGSPDPLRFVRPGHGHGVVAADDRNGTGAHGGEIERHRYGGRLQRHETERGEQHDMHDGRREEDMRSHDCTQRPGCCKPWARGTSDLPARRVAIGSIRVARRAGT